MKKTLSAAAVLICLTALLTGCRDGMNTETAPTGQTAATQSTTAPTTAPATAPTTIPTTAPTAAPTTDSTRETEPTASIQTGKSRSNTGAGATSAPAAGNRAGR